MANYKYKVIMKNGDIHYGDEIKNEKSSLKIIINHFFKQETKEITIFDIEVIEEKKLDITSIIIFIIFLIIIILIASLKGAGYLA